MKRVVVEIRESYIYDSYNEFVQHYNEMISKGFKPSSESSRPNYYVNYDMPEYYAEYHKRKSNC